MLKYIIKRILGMIPLVFGITIITFVVIHITPGKPTDLQTQLNPKVSAQVRERLEKLYGLDKPLHIQYINWLKRLLVLDFGQSFIDKRSVAEKIRERIPITLLINILALLLILSVAVPIGISSALRHRSFYDQAMTIFVFIGFSTPGFWFALICMLIFGVKLGWLPVSGLHSIGYVSLSGAAKFIDLIRHLILPVLVSAFGGLAGFSRYMKTSTLDIIHQDYIRTAWAKGLSKKKVIYKHVLKNALLPVITIMGLSVPGLIGGSVIIESIFAIPGMGQMMYESVMARDYPMVMGVLFISAVLTLLGNLLADVTYGLVDPRIRVSEK